MQAVTAVVPTTQALTVVDKATFESSHVPSHGRALQTEVSDVTGLIDALGNAAVSHIVIAAGHYYLTAELSVTRSVIIDAEVEGSVVLDAQGNSRVLNINPGSSGEVQLIGLNITGGSADVSY